MVILIAHIGWMARYVGLKGQPDKIVGGGKWVDEHATGAEVCNFLPCEDGYVYGHFETIKGNSDRSVRIEFLGAESGDTSVDNVTVIWTATEPLEHGRRVIGWSKGASVFRDRVSFSSPPSPQHRRDKLKDFRVRTTSSGSTLLRLEDRTLRLGTGAGWAGQANWWFAERSANPEVKAFLNSLKRLMSEENKKAPSQAKGRWGRGADPERNAAVERAAIQQVVRFYSRLDARSVEKENRGWDLEFNRGGEKLCVEVKGLSASDLRVGLTPREFQAMNLHMEGGFSEYRFAVVTDALGEFPRLYVFRYNRDRSVWTDEVSGNIHSPEITKLQAAIFSI